MINSFSITWSQLKTGIEISSWIATILSFLLIIAIFYYYQRNFYYKAITNIENIKKRFSAELYRAGIKIISNTLKTLTNSNPLTLDYKKYKIIKKSIKIYIKEIKNIESFKQKWATKFPKKENYVLFSMNIIENINKDFYRTTYFDFKGKKLKDDYEIKHSFGGKQIFGTISSWGKEEKINNIIMNKDIISHINLFILNNKPDEHKIGWRLVLNPLFGYKKIIRTVKKEIKGGNLILNGITFPSENQ